MESLIKQYKLFWQYPVITEKEFNLQNKDNPFFLGFPWATIIDKRYNLNIIYKILFPSIQKDRQYYTCCQHIHFRQLIPLFKSLNIHIVYCPHKIKDEDEINGIRILPCPLYAVNIEDDTRNHEFQNIDFINKERKYLYSFMGGVQAGYLTNVRNQIFQMQHPEDAFIVNTGDWHFNSTVYSSKQNMNQELNINENHIQKTKKYNEVLLNSRFSLCPSGSGPNSIRFWESLACGAIPVLLADTLDLPHHELWKKAIVIIPEKEVVHINKYLNDINQEEERERLKNCLILYQHFRSNYNMNLISQTQAYQHYNYI